MPLLQPATLAPPTPTARPIAAGQVQSQTDSSARPLTYEIWAAPEGGAWIDIFASSDVPPVRLSGVTLSAFQHSIDSHVGEATVVESMGVGVGGGVLSMEVPMAWAGLTVGSLLLTLGLGLVAWRSRARADRLQQLARHEVASRERERARVAREIHDGPLQELAMLARSEAPSDERVRSRLREVGAELRSLAAGLMPPALERLGLSAALEDLAGRWADAPTPLKVRVDLCEAPDLDPETSLTLYRAAQEALTNASAHGEASTAWVFMRRQDGRLMLIVRDDGRGLPGNLAGSGRDLRRLIRNGHLGLAGMLDRAQALGGEASIQAGPSGLGTELVVALPRT